MDIIQQQMPICKYQKVFKATEKGCDEVPNMVDIGAVILVSVGQRKSNVFA